MGRRTVQLLYELRLLVRSLECLAGEAANGDGSFSEGAAWGYGYGAKALREIIDRYSPTEVTVAPRDNNAGACDKPAQPLSR